MKKHIGIITTVGLVAGVAIGCLIKWAKDVLSEEDMDDYFDDDIVANDSSFDEYDDFDRAQSMKGALSDD